MTDARSAGADPGARGHGVGRVRGLPARPVAAHSEPTGDQPVRHPVDPRVQRPVEQPIRHPIAAYLRANPQVLALLVICIVLGLGTFLAVLVSLVTAGSDQTTGEPSGVILGAHGIVSSLRAAFL